MERLLRITRLGDGVDRSGRLADDAIGRVSQVVDAYVERARDLAAARILAVATSAVRDASNGRGFLAALADRHGIAWRLLTGGAEAAMTFRSVASDRRPPPKRSSATSAAAAPSWSSAARTALPTRSA